MRCPDCNKFVGLDFEAPEEPDTFDFDVGLSDDEKRAESVVVEATVRIVRTCADCGAELKEAELEMSSEAEFVEHDLGPDCEVYAEMDEVQAIEEGGGRYKKSYYGLSIDYSIKCACDREKVLTTGSMSEKVAASEMEELV